MKTMNKECTQDHRWDWDNESWICTRCGKVAASTNAHIEPCPQCGAEADTDVPYCEECA